MSYFFLSHSSENNAQALALARWLEEHGWSEYFLDISETSGLESGSSWQSELKNATHRCEAVIILLSSPWNDSKWCLSEFLLAKQLGKQIFGVLVDDVPLDQLPNELTVEYQLCDLVNGDTHSTFDVVREPFVPSTRVDFPEVGLSALKRGLQRAGLEANSFTWPPEDDPERAPYRGLKPYEVKDAAVFFGRDADIVRGLDQVRQLRIGGIEQLLVVLGASGSGKSSFMRAGLLPRLERDDHHFCPLPVVRPGGAAMSGEEGLINCLATALAKAGVAKISRGDIRNRFNADPDGQTLLYYLQQLSDTLSAKADGETPKPTFILPIDQGEELYASDGVEESLQLRKQLASLNQPSGKVTAQQNALSVLAVVTIRTDLYVHLQSDAQLRDIGRQMIDLTPMDRTEYKRIIEGPAQRATEAGKALIIEPALSEQLLADTQGADALPMLAFTLERLYSDYGEDGDLTLEEYHLLGGVTGSLTAAIDAALSSPQNAPVIPADKVEQQRLLRQAFIPWLAEVDEQSGERRRRVASWNELPTKTHPMLERLTHMRLLLRDVRSDGDGNDKREVVEVAHEALLRRWPSLVDWLDADADSLKSISAVSRAAKFWADKQREDDFLDHRGERLVDAEKLLEREDFKQRLEATGCDYLARCRAFDDERKELERQQLEAERKQIEKERQQTQRLRVAFAAMVLLAVGAVGAAMWGFDSSNKAMSAQGEAKLAQVEAESAKELAEKQRAIAQNERDQGLRTLSLMHAGLSQQQTKKGHATRGILLALEALPESLENTEHTERPYAREATAALYAALNALHERKILKGHEHAVKSAAFSPDGTQVVTASDDTTARVWDVATGKQVVKLKGHDGGVNSAAFSPDGTQVVTASEDETARVWDVQTGTLVTKLTGHVQRVYSAAFSPDGTQVVTASRDSTARVWDVPARTLVATLTGHEDAVYSAAFSPDGTQVVTNSRDNTARVWDVATGTPVAKLSAGHEIGVISAVFSPDGTQVVTASGDKTARVWDVRTDTLVAKFSGHEDTVYRAAFSPDGTQVVTASYDKTASVWDVQTGTLVTELTGHEDRVLSATFSPDGTQVVTTSVDKIAIVWDVATGTPVAKLSAGHEKWLYSAVFSPDGTQVVTASDDKTARVWDVAAGTPVAKLSGHQSWVYSAAFSPDGTQVVTASTDSTARVWDVQARTQVAKFTGHHQTVVNSAAFSPDGTQVVTASRDKTARVWDVATGTPVAVLTGHENGVKSAAFSPDGTQVVTASDDKTALVWDVQAGTPVAKLTGHEHAVQSAAFSPDGTQVVTASYDKTARVWDVPAGTLVTELTGHENAVTSAAFSPDGTQVVTASIDNTARVWDVATGTQVTVLTGHHENDVTSAAFSPDGTQVVTASIDSTALVWDVQAGTPVAKLTGHENAVHSAAFSLDGTQVVTASEDKTARVWNVQTGQMLIDLANERVPRKDLTKKEKKQFFVLTE